jgi:hypothetical protein
MATHADLLRPERAEAQQIPWHFVKPAFGSGKRALSWLASMADIYIYAKFKN